MPNRSKHNKMLKQLKHNLEYDTDSQWQYTVAVLQGIYKNKLVMGTSVLSFKGTGGKGEGVISCWKLNVTLNLPFSATTARPNSNDWRGPWSNPWLVDT